MNEEETSALNSIPKFREVAFAPLRHRFDEAKLHGRSFVHYTSASNAMRILKDEAVTLRSTPFMNDFSEIRYGENLVRNSVFQQSSFRFQSVLEGIRIGLAQLVIRYFEEYGRFRAFETYMLCISEHGSDIVDEDDFGRLSIWRAYGGDTNVALVMNSAPFLQESDALRAYSYPVHYKDQAQFSQLIDEWLTGLEAVQNDVSELPIEELARVLAYFLHVLTISTKHPGFAEEREWRIVYEPNIQKSQHMKEDYIEIHGIPQRVFKFGLKNIPDEQFTGVEPNEILERLIIGPSSYPWPMREAFVEQMTRAKIESASEKVWVSDIPIRR